MLQAQPLSNGAATPRLSWKALAVLGLTALGGTGLARLHDSGEGGREEASALRAWMAGQGGQEIDAAALHLTARSADAGDPRSHPAPVWAVYRSLPRPRLHLFRPAGAGADSAAPGSEPVMAAFSTPLGLNDRQRALDCLTAAVHYEAAGEPRDGQAAVAQVVLNRVHAPGFPKSVCGVVFQGSDLATGCQFTFTCDGSLHRRPTAAAWRRAQEVAEEVLDGRLPSLIGVATHYHADYVRPYWSAALTRIGQIGAHIFYRARRPFDRPPPGAFRAEEGGWMSDARAGWRDPTAVPSGHASRRGHGFSFRVATPEPLTAGELKPGQVFVLGRS